MQTSHQARSFSVRSIFSFGLEIEISEAKDLRWSVEVPQLLELAVLVLQQGFHKGLNLSTVRYLIRGIRKLVL